MSGISLIQSILDTILHYDCDIVNREPDFFLNISSNEEHLPIKTLKNYFKLEMLSVFQEAGDSMPVADWAMALGRFPDSSINWTPSTIFSNNGKPGISRPVAFMAA